MNKGRAYDQVAVRTALNLQFLVPVCSCSQPCNLCIKVYTKLGTTLCDFAACLQTVLCCQINYALKVHQAFTCD